MGIQKSQLNETKRIVVLVEDRVFNEVDVLKQQIEALEAKILTAQKDCQHDMRLLKNLPLLRESLVKGVFFLSEYPDRLGIRCLQCSYEIKFGYTSRSLLLMCPRCLGKLKWVYQAGNYFDANCWAGKYPAAERYDCTECELKYVWPIDLID